MAVGLALEYRSRLALHRHVCWCGGPPVDEPAIPPFDPDRVERLPVASFNQRLVPLKLGRFYPARILDKAPVEGRRFRVIAVDDEVFVADFNHPLASHEVVHGREHVDGEGMGRVEMLLQWAGMDAPLADADTQFDDPNALQRGDPGDDAGFYARPRRVLHIDHACAARITALYASILAPGVQVLDLMSGWRSHLPQHVGPVVGLGMNAEEMGDNPQLAEHVVHDLNREPALPFPQASFDAVVNTVSFEYLTRPGAVLGELHRVLRPGGVLAVTFSNRYFPPKAVRLWTRLHSMECVGWVLQQLHQAGFTDLHTRIEQGLKRPADDSYAERLDEMDPLFAVWGRRPEG